MRSPLVQVTLPDWAVAARDQRLIDARIVLLGEVNRLERELSGSGVEPPGPTSKR